VINTLISSGNNAGLEWAFIPRGRSLMYIINNENPKIDPCGTPDLFIPQFEDFSCSF
jgi:hypothetical protein